MWPSFHLLLALASTAHAVGVAPKQIKNVVTFGDSYTDTVLVSDGGVPWPVYLSGDANLTLFPFARSGATCSNNITFRPFPSLFESQLPAYFAQKANSSSALSDVEARETLYTLWIGTNDVGVSALLTGDSALPGPRKATIVDTTTCAVNWVRTMYNAGARNFLFQNIVPLEQIPLYSADSYPNHYWALERNTTEWSVFMRELVQSGNALSRLMLQALAPTLKGAHVGLFDSNALFQDIIDRPSEYLNGTLPVNVKESISACVYELNGDDSTRNCTLVPAGAARDSYLWFDELHPSEQADRIVAREIAVAATGGRSEWTTWFS